MAVNDFEGWPQLDVDEPRDLIYFAVKKEHDMSYKYDVYNKIQTYSERIKSAILEGTNDFEYHNHTYSVSLNEDGNYDVISNGEKVAEAMIEDGECIVEIEQDKNDYIRNTKSKHYEDMYKDLFNKVRTKEYGINSSDEFEI